MPRWKKYLRRLYMKTDYQFFNPLLHIFVLKTLAFGLYFTFLGSTEAISETNLYQLTTDYLPSNAGNFWGLCLLLVVFGHILEMEFRGKGFGGWVGILGFMCWLYAGFIYATTGQWFAFTGYVAGDLFFWGWYMVSSNHYRHQLQEKLIPKVS